MRKWINWILNELECSTQIVHLLCGSLELENLWEELLYLLVAVNELFTERIKSAGILSCQMANNKTSDDQTVSLIRPHFFSYSHKQTRDRVAQQKFSIAIVHDEPAAKADRRSHRERTEKKCTEFVWAEVNIVAAYWIS